MNLRYRVGRSKRGNVVQRVGSGSQADTRTHPGAKDVPAAAYVSFQETKE